ncbi:YeeE/YedE family protein [Rhodobacteraceae bacterium CCMM004]|nr:YeeE/YedE family protein [Rhodobacteraceae bacterium CCMM004]
MLETLIDTIGDAGVLGLAGLITGLLFGAFAQHSRFCLRAATLEVGAGHMGARTAVWLLAFCTALFGMQAARQWGLIDVREARQLAQVGSMSGAIVGGVLFGVGMILARGCASRLLVLSGTGNMRALVTGLIVTLVAQASLTGVLAAPREWLAGLWTINGGAARDLAVWAGLPPWIVTVLAAVALAVSAAFAVWRRVPWSQAVAGVGVGLAVVLGWGLTFAIASTSFEIVPLSSVTFTGPSTDTLLALVGSREVALSFGTGLVPGVFVGSALTALATREWRIERFGPETPMERYLVGAVLMGFGAMLAGGCAVGAGLSGGAILSITAWVAVASMWAGALAAGALLTPGLPGARTA